ncbi:MAG: hypothetical protein J6J07_05900 [Oscillospiraceae bacterium]|nr:hypothetical protein [Oscillospiraceae bacterium]
MSKKSFLTALCAVSLCAILLFSGTNLSEGIRRGLFLCSYSVIPALFPFMALSVFICRSSAAEFFSKLFRPITKLLKIPENCGGILLAAAIGGYPAAAKCINDSVCGGFLDRKTASRMLCFCVNAGPPFLISAVGIGVFGSIRTGFLLFAAQFLSSAIIAVLLSCFSKKTETCREHYSTIYRSNSALIVESIISAAESCFRMCAFIVIACGILEIASAGTVFGFSEEKPFAAAILSGFFEVTAGVFSCAEIGGFSAIVAAGAIASFSGISVILQVAAVTEESEIPLFPFIVSRFFHAGITAAILRIFFAFSKDTAAVFSANGGSVEAVLSASAPAAVSLLCMASLFLLSIVPPKSEKEPFLSRIWNKFNIFWHSQT